MYNPRVRLKIQDMAILDIGLWDLINLHIVSSWPWVTDIAQCDLYLNGEKVDKPIYEEEE